MPCSAAYDRTAPALVSFSKIASSTRGGVNGNRRKRTPRAAFTALAIAAATLLMPISPTLFAP